MNSVREEAVVRKIISVEAISDYLKSGFLTKEEFHLLLWGVYHPRFREDNIEIKFTSGKTQSLYSDFNLKIQSEIERIDCSIDDAVELGTLQESKKNIDRDLFRENFPISWPQNEPGYETQGLFELLVEKGYPIPRSIMNGIIKKRWVKTAQYFSNLQKIMVLYLENNRRSVRSNILFEEGEYERVKTQIFQKSKSAQLEDAVQPMKSNLVEGDSRRAEGSAAETSNPQEICDEITFSRRGDLWEIGVDNILIFNHMDGLAYMEYLLQRPNDPISCVTLSELKNRPGLDEKSKGLFEDKSESTVSRDQPDGRQTTNQRNPADKKSSKTLKSEILELKHDVEEAENNKSPDLDICRREYEEKTALFNSLYDRSGKPRDEATAESKARKNVSKAIQRARDKIQEKSPEMVKYLKYINRGTEVVFSPPLDLKFRVK